MMISKADVQDVSRSMLDKVSSWRGMKQMPPPTYFGGEAANFSEEMKKLAAEMAEPFASSFKDIAREAANLAREWNGSGQQRPPPALFADRLQTLAAQVSQFVMIYDPSASGPVPAASVRAATSQGDDHSTVTLVSEEVIADLESRVQALYDLLGKATESQIALEQKVAAFESRIVLLEKLAAAKP